MKKILASTIDTLPLIADEDLKELHKKSGEELVRRNIKEKDMCKLNEYCKHGLHVMEDCFQCAHEYLESKYA